MTSRKVPTPKPYSVFNALLTPEMHIQLRILSIEMGVSASAIVREALRVYLGKAPSRAELGAARRRVADAELAKKLAKRKPRPMTPEDPDEAVDRGIAEGIRRGLKSLERKRKIAELEKRRTKR